LPEWTDDLDLKLCKTDQNNKMYLNGLLEWTDDLDLKSVHFADAGYLFGLVDGPAFFVFGGLSAGA
jgi:hypothetical protein